MNDWTPTSIRLPAEDQVVYTKIDDGYCARNEQKLKRSGNLWFSPDDSMYVYYVPTHWKPL